VPSARPLAPEACRVLRVLAATAAILAAAFTAAASSETLLVSAAASLKEALREAARRFEAAHPGTRVDVNVAASGVLLRQIEEGAPVDLFLSASREEIGRLEKEGRIESGSSRPLAANRLVVVVPAGAPPPASLAGLGDRRFERIAVGNPRTVPAGRYAEQALRSAGVLDAVRERLVPGESVRQVLEYVARGEVAAGLVYATDARAFEGKVGVGPQAPEGSHDAIVYFAAVLRDARNGTAAAGLMAFLLSEEGRRILARHGFLPPPPP
jgi:molybdate transport system substrate-binding protein